MSPLIEQPNTLWPLLVYFGSVVALIAAMLGLAWFTGGRHNDRLTGQPFESGVIPVGSARLRFSVKFYLVAIFFVIFDLEVVFIFAWAIAAREVGWLGYIEAMVFVGILTLALVYAWRIGALEWGPRVPRRRPPGTETVQLKGRSTSA